MDVIFEYKIQYNYSLDSFKGNIPQSRIKSHFNFCFVKLNLKVLKNRGKRLVNVSKKSKYKKEKLCVKFM